LRKRGNLHWAWVILGICFVDLFINYSVRLGYSIVLPEMIRDLNFTRTAGGSIYNSYLFVYITITPFTGFLTDRFGARKVISACLLILGTGVFLMGAVETLWAACLSYAIAGVGATGLWTPVVALVQRWFTPRRRGLALGILSTGYGLGFATMGIAFPWIVSRFSWRYSWYFLGAAALSMVAANGLLLRRDPESAGWWPWGQKEVERSPGTEPIIRAHASTLKQVFRSRTFWLIGLSYASISYSLYGITTFMVDYAKYQMSLPLNKASFLATIHGGSQVLGVLTILPLSDLLGRRKTLILANAFIAVSLMGILLSGNSLGVLYASVGIMAFFYGAVFPMYGACAGDYFPREVLATVMGSWTPFYGFGAILVHWVSGFLRDATGSYAFPFAINTAMALLGTILMFAVRGDRSDQPAGIWDDP